MVSLYRSTNNSSFYLKLEIPIEAGEKAQKKKEEKKQKQAAKKITDNAT